MAQREIRILYWLLSFSMFRLVMYLGKPAVRSCKKVAFKMEEHFKQDVVINGECRDVILMGICADRFR